MPTLRYEGQLAAGGSIVNLLAGSKFELLPFPAAVAIFAVQDNAGVGLLLMDFTMGNMIEVDGASVPTYTATLGPDRDKHGMGAGVSARHDRLQIKLSNTDGANASNYRVLVDIRPL